MNATDFQRFMFEQKIKQSDLAKYLGVSEGYISQVVSGKKQLSEDKLGKVLNNPYGWDVSMLKDRGDENVVEEKPAQDEAITTLLGLLAEKDKDIRTLIEMLKKKDEQIDELRNELDARKGGTAPSVVHSSAADAI